MQLSKKFIFLLLILLSFIVVNAQIDLPEYPVCINTENDTIENLIQKSKINIENDVVKSFCLLYKAKNKAKKTTQKSKIAKVAAKLSAKLYKQAKFNEAIYFQSLTASVWQDLDSVNNYTSSIIKLGFDYYRLGDMYSTFKYINLGLELSKKNNQKIEEYKCLYELAWANWRIGNCDEAVKYINLSKEIIDQGFVKNRLIFYYNSLSSFYMCKGDAKKAILEVNKAIKLTKKNTRFYGVIKSNKADYLINDEANANTIIKMVLEVLEINKKNNNLEQLGSNYGLLAKAYIYNKEYNKAIKFALKGKKIAKKIGDLPRILENTNFLKEAYTKNKNYTNALKYSEKYNTLYKKLYGTENSNKIFELQKENAKVQSDNIINSLKKEKELSELKTKQGKEIYWLLTAMFLILLGVLLSYFNRKKMLQKQKIAFQNERLNSQLLQMEMEALRSRMNPHFLFNSLNSIKSFIATNNPREASNYLSKFANLVRMILNHSKEKTITLADELNAIKYYVTIEKMRLKDSFDFNINIDENCNLEDILIPPSIIQPFVENAIWHGFSQLNKKGKLYININCNSKNIIIEIIDNGVGRKKAAEQNKQKLHKSIGIDLIKKTIAIYKTENISDIKIKTIDLYTNIQEAKGTKVIITIKNNE